MVYSAFVTGFIILAGTLLYEMIEDKKMDKKIKDIEIGMDGAYQINIARVGDMETLYVDGVVMDDTLILNCGQDGATIPFDKNA